MCRGRSKRCVLLDADASKWSALELVPAVPEVEQGFAHFEAAVRAAADGDTHGARARLLGVAGDVLQQWYIEHAQVAGTRRLARPRPVHEPFAGGVDKHAYPRSRLEEDVFAADGFRCRYCQRRIVTRRLLKAFHAVVGQAAFPMGRTNASTHGAALVYRAVADHVVPRKRGGRTDRANLVTACYPCNFGKADYDLVEIKLSYPRPPLLDGWDGLEPLVPALIAQAQVACSWVPGSE